MATAGIPIVFVHFPEVSDASMRAAAATALPERIDHIMWYCQWLRGQGCSVHVLLPSDETLERKALIEAEASELIVCYDDDGIALSKERGAGIVWLVNGRDMPVINWREAQRVSRRRCDITLFGRRPERGYYPESVVVDSEGRVLRFCRHYSDSPCFADRWSGQPSFLSVSARHASRVVNHVLVRGWDLDSIGALTRQFRIRWSPTPCLWNPEDDGDQVMRVEGSTAWVESPTFPGVGLETGTPSPAGPGLDAGDAPDSPVDQAARPDVGGYLAAKRAIDVLAALFGLVLLSPLLLVIAAVVKVTSRGPVLFGHWRQGLHGKEFQCWKFRSMKIGADRMQAELRALNEVDGPQFKITKDPRLTCVGGILRKLNLDELPQLYNVLLGAMSLVGPRPSPDAENRVCPAWRRARLSVKPGITGLWQALRSRRDSTSDFQEWIYYDTEYARHCSLWLDILILLYTPVALVAPARTHRLRERLARRGICRHPIGGAENADGRWDPQPFDSQPSCLRHDPSRRVNKR